MAVDPNAAPTTGGLGGLGGIALAPDGSPMPSPYNPTAPSLAGVSANGQTAYYNTLYQQLMGTQANPQMVQSWVDQNQAPTDVIQQIVASPNYRQDQISNAYQQYFGRAPSPQELNTWNNSSSSVDDINNLLANSGEAQSYAATQAANAAPQGSPQPLGPNEPSGPLGPKNLMYQTLPWSQNGNAIDQLSAFYNQAFTTLGAQNPLAATEALLGSSAVEDPGFSPTQTQNNSNSPNAGQGIWQLTGARYNGNPNPANHVLNYLQFSQQNGYDPSSLEAQARYGLYSLVNDPTYSGANGRSNAALKNFLGAQNVSQAMSGARAFESPQNWNASSNQRLANAVAVGTYLNGGGITQSQLNTFFGGGNNGIANNAFPAITGPSINGTGSPQAPGGNVNINAGMSQTPDLSGILGNTLVTGASPTNPIDTSIYTGLLPNQQPNTVNDFITANNAWMLANNNPTAINPLGSLSQFNPTYNPLAGTTPGLNVGTIGNMSGVFSPSSGGTTSNPVSLTGAPSSPSIMGGPGLNFVPLTINGAGNSFSGSD